MKGILCNLVLIGLATVLLGQRPTIGGYNVYYGNLHNHSTYSDGSGTPSQAYSTAKANGLDFFSLTDHAEQLTAAEYASVVSTANSYNQDGVFATFYGFEWSSSTYGHIAVTNAPVHCTANQSETNTFDELMAWISQYDCVAWFNHPGREGSQSFDRFDDAANDKVVGMELWNKAIGFSEYYYNDGFYSNDGSLGYWDEALARGWKLGASGAEDNHGTDWGADSDHSLAVLANSLTRSDLFAAMKARRFYSTEDKGIVLSFKAAGAEMGSSVEGATNGIQVQAYDQNGESFTQVALFKNGFEYRTYSINTASVNVTDNVSMSDGDFFYVKVTQADGDEAVSSPIWVDGGISNNEPVCAVSSPANASYYAFPQTITVSATAYDSDGSISGVDFYVGSVLIGSDNSAPYAINYSISANGIYTITATATDNLGATASSSVSIAVGSVTETVSARIAESIDDVEEAPDGTVYTNSTDIELVFDDYNGGGNQTVGLRFTDLNIPQGATITSATIQFACDETNSETTALTIRGHAADNAPQFNASVNDVSSRTTTAASISWNPTAWNAVGEAGSAQQTPDLSSIVQEIVNRSGFDFNSAIAFVITGSGERTAESFDGSSSAAPLLTVTYSLGSPNIAPVCSVSNPLDGSHFLTPQTVSISANASDTDGSVAEVEFFVNNVSVGVDYYAPYSLNYVLSADGDYEIKAVATDDQGASATSSIVHVSVGNITETVSSRINQSIDDVEEVNGGYVYMNSTDIELVYDDYNGPVDQVVGLRFSGLNIPQGATITSAAIQFTCDEVNTGSTSLTIKAEDVDNAPPFTSASYDVSSRTRTSASVNWSPLAWNTVGESGSAQMTPDLSAVVQEIVSRSGFNASSAIAFIITGTGERTAIAYDGSSVSAPLLTVSYTLGEVNNPPACAISSPVNGTQYNAPQTIAISANASDTDGSIAGVEFFVNNVSVGVDYYAPYSLNYTLLADGDYEIKAVATDDQGASATSSVVGVSVGYDVETVSSRINQSIDDVEEVNGGYVYMNSTDIELVYDEYNGPVNQIVGLRFSNLNIPQGATITSANIQFTCDELNSGATTLTIKGEAVDNASQFTSVAYNVSSRPTTSASVNWMPSAWNLEGEAGSAQQTPDLSAVLQEIVSRGGFNANSAVAFIITGTGERTAESYDGSVSAAPLLTVEYTLAPMSVPAQVIADAGELKNGLEPGDENVQEFLTDEKEIELAIYPNPARGRSVSVAGVRMENALVSVVDVRGKLVYTQTISKEKTEIEVSHLPAGTYYVVVAQGDETNVSLLLIE